MEAVVKEKIEEFGNPSAYHENRLYHIFAEHGQEDLCYLMVFYGLHQGEHIKVDLSSKYRGYYPK